VLKIPKQMHSRDGQLTSYRDYFVGSNRHGSISDNQNQIIILKIEEIVIYHIFGVFVLVVKWTIIMMDS